MSGQPGYTDKEVLTILHLKDNVGMTAEDIGKRYGTTRSGILGLIKRVRDAEKPCQCVKPENKEGGMGPLWWQR